jgi:hypothetical protein
MAVSSVAQMLCPNAQSQAGRGLAGMACSNKDQRGEAALSVRVPPASAS